MEIAREIFLGSRAFVGNVKGASVELDHCHEPVRWNRVNDREKRIQHISFQL